MLGLVVAALSAEDESKLGGNGRACVLVTRLFKEGERASQTSLGFGQSERLHERGGHDWRDGPEPEVLGLGECELVQAPGLIGVTEHRVEAAQKSAYIGSSDDVARP